MNVGFTVGGADAANYDVTANSTTTASIDKLALSTTIGALDKTYDGNNSAPTTGRM